MIFSLEQPRKELASRLICSNANIDGRNYRATVLDAEEIQRVRIAAAKISDMPIYIDDYPGQGAT
jgi:replicative DNA helicase